MRIFPRSSTRGKLILVLYKSLHVLGKGNNCTEFLQSNITSLMVNMKGFTEIYKT